MGSVRSRIPDRGRNGRDTRLAHAAGGFSAFKEMHLDLRRLSHPQDRVIVETALLHPSVLERDSPVKRRGKTEGDRRFHLRLDDARVDHLAAIDRADHLSDAQPRIGIDRDLGHVGDETTERLMDGDPASVPLRHRFPPTRLPGSQFQNPPVS